MKDLSLLNNRRISLAFEFW